MEVLFASIVWENVINVIIMDCVMIVLDLNAKIVRLRMKRYAQVVWRTNVKCVEITFADIAYLYVIFVYMIIAMIVWRLNAKNAANIDVKVVMTILTIAAHILTIIVINIL